MDHYVAVKKNEEDPIPQTKKKRSAVYIQFLRSKQHAWYASFYERKGKTLIHFFSYIEKTKCPSGNETKN